MSSWTRPSRGQIILLSVIGAGALYFLLHSSSSSSSKTPLATPSPDVKGKAAFRQRLVAVGDLHGDIDNAKKVLRMAKIIDQSGDWSGGTDILVQTGDIVDRGAHALDIYRLMQKLRGQASGIGGQVVSILGNHEVMNAIGDWRYVTKDDIDQFGSTEERLHDLSSDGWLGQEWLANYTTTALVSLGPHESAPKLSFTHGSLRPSYIDLTPYPSRINDLGHSLLTRALTPPMAKPHPPNRYSGLPKGTPQEEAALYAEGGPYWWRGLAEMKDEKVVCGWAKELREKLGVGRIIGGHTPDFTRIVDRCNASIIIIDTGISKAYGGVLSALEIIYTLTPVSSSNPDSNHRQDPFLASTELKQGHSYTEREEVHASYERRKKLLALEERTVVL